MSDLDTTAVKRPAIKLEVKDPTPLMPGSLFGIYLPENLDLNGSFDAIVQAIEFRRKCMNQGFDNLLELLANTKANLKADVDAVGKNNEATPV